ncbi:MAG: HAD-IA family hydrolase [Jannaschia sp.]
MQRSAILFGAIGTLAETSELQRRAFNLAFRTFDLDWVWEPAAYYKMLRAPGGRARVQAYADRTGDHVDADAVHALKEEIFEMLLAASPPGPRAGVADLIEACRAERIPVAFCSTTSRRQVEATVSGLTPGVSPADFAWVGDRTSVTAGKPAPDIYLKALSALDADGKTALVIEDTPESAEAALGAGLDVIGFPGRAARGRAFPQGVPVTDWLDPRLLRGSLGLAAE